MDATNWTHGFQEMMILKPMEQIMIPNSSPHQSNTTSNARQNTILTSNVVSAAAAAVSGVSKSNNTAVVVERKARPQEKINCPRCNSTNTKFCYYNNYSLTQPRYFCKGCRRYWTEGGSLRNVPVGGSSRKNMRSSSSNILQKTDSSLQYLNPSLLFSNQIPNKSKGSSQDLNLLSFPVMQDQHQNHVHMSHFLEVPSGPMMDSSNNVIYTSSRFPTMVDYKPSNLSFSTDHQGLEHNNNNNRSEAHNDHHQGRVLFPFGDQMKELSSSITQEVDLDYNQQQKNYRNNNNNLSYNNRYWSGMFSTTGEGSSW